jgi:hypothetical protein
VHILYLFFNLVFQLFVIRIEEWYVPRGRSIRRSVLLQLVVPGEESRLERDPRRADRPVFRFAARQKQEGRSAQSVHQPSPLVSAREYYSLQIRVQIINKLCCW